MGYFRSESEDTLSTRLLGTRWGRTGGEGNYVDTGVSKALRDLMGDIRATCEREVSACIARLCDEYGCDAGDTRVAEARADLLRFLECRVAGAECVTQSDGTARCFEVIECLTKVRLVLALFRADSAHTLCSFLFQQLMQDSSVEGALVNFTDAFEFGVACIRDCTRSWCLEV